MPAMKFVYTESNKTEAVRYGVASAILADVEPGFQPGGPIALNGREGALRRPRRGRAAQPNARKYRIPPAERDR